MNTACAHWKLDENGDTRCCLPVCACKLETTDISHLSVKSDAFAEIGYNPYNKPYGKIRRHQPRKR